MMYPPQFTPSSLEQNYHTHPQTLHSNNCYQQPNLTTQGMPRDNFQKSEQQMHTMHSQLANMTIEQHEPYSSFNSSHPMVQQNIPSNFQYPMSAQPQQQSELMANQMTHAPPLPYSHQQNNYYGAPTLNVDQNPYPIHPRHAAQYPGTMPSPYPDNLPAPPLQARKISIEKLPSAIEFMNDNRAQFQGPFCTGQRSVVPPLVTTNFTTRDEGNCSPHFVRSSLYAIPYTADLMKTVGVPFTLTISPFAAQHDDDPSLVISDMGPQGPIRCVRCRSYMSPFVSFIDGGRRFVCPLCNGCTDVPTEYFAHLDHTGRRTDVYSRPELCLGSYELLATAEYCKNNQLPLSPAFIFLLDVSQSAVRSGLVRLFCSLFTERILPNLPKEEFDRNGSTSSIRIGFITYDHQLHFYSFGRDTSGTATVDGYPVHQHHARPQMHIVADVDDVFIPAVEGFLIEPDPHAVTELLQLIPAQFSSDGPPGQVTAADSVLGPAIQAGLEALRAANRPGKLFVMNTNLPTSEAPGKLKNRDNRQLVGTEKEKTLLVPIGDFYTGLGQSCVESGCSVDLFLFPNSSTDVATLAEIPRLTTGRLYKYNCFQYDLQGLQFIHDLEMAVSRPCAFNAVMRVRTSAGIRPVEFFGNFHLPNTTDVELASLDPDTGVTVELKHDDKLNENDAVFIQVACLYTSIAGQRRLRIHNLSLSIANTPTEIFRLTELDAHMNWLGKLGVRSLCSKPHVQVIEDLTSKTATVLAAYRKLCANDSGEWGGQSGELVLPQNMKLYPLYVQCLMKTDAFMPADNISIDDRCFSMFLLNGMDVRASNAYIYPRLYPVCPLQNDDELATTYPPPAIRCSHEFLNTDGAYLMDNGVTLFLWLGTNISVDWVKAVFNVLGVRQFEPERVYDLPRLDNDSSRNLCILIDRAHREHSRHTRLFVVRSGDKLETRFRCLLVEDKHCGNATSYMDYIIHIHKEVRSLLR